MLFFKYWRSPLFHVNYYFVIKLCFQKHHIGKLSRYGYTERKRIRNWRHFQMGFWKSKSYLSKLHFQIKTNNQFIGIILCPYPELKRFVLLLLEPDHYLLEYHKIVWCSDTMLICELKRLKTILPHCLHQCMKCFSVQVWYMQTRQIFSTGYVCVLKFLSGEKRYSTMGIHNRGISIKGGTCENDDNFKSAHTVYIRSLEFKISQRRQVKADLLKKESITSSQEYVRP